MKQNKFYIKNNDIYRLYSIRQRKKYMKDIEYLFFIYNSIL